MGSWEYWNKNVWITDWKALYNHSGCFTFHRDFDDGRIAMMEDAILMIKLDRDCDGVLAEQLTVMIEMI